MTAAFNRRMRKTARTVVWEGAGVQSPALDPIVLANLADISAVGSAHRFGSERRI